MTELHHQLITEIRSSGPLSFARFMEAALYEPMLGYYERPDLQRFGSGGDFTTSPEIGRFFAAALANQLMEIIDAIPHAVVRELGAGSGKLAADLLAALRKRDQVPYEIVERSQTLIELQRERLGAEFDQRVTWLTEQRRDFCGVIIANEVIDALPAHRIAWRNGQWWSVVVTERQGTLAYAEQPLSNELLDVVAKIDTSALVDGYLTEVRPGLSDWLSEVTADLQQGVILFFDYGYPRREFYHPQRVDGTAIAYREHHSSDDLLATPGEQDLTAFVDFTSVAEAADDCGLDVLGFCGQGSFLLSCDILAALQSAPVDQRDAAAEVRRLTLPGEMGERFKVMALGCHFHEPLRGFAMTNQTHLL